MFTWSTVFMFSSFYFQLFCVLTFKVCVLQKYCRIWFFTQSNHICLIVGMVSLFIFNVITDLILSLPTFSVFVFTCFICSFVFAPPLLASFGLSKISLLFCLFYYIKLWCFDDSGNKLVIQKACAKIHSHRTYL